MIYPNERDFLYKMGIALQNLFKKIILIIQFFLFLIRLLKKYFKITDFFDFSLKLTTVRLLGLEIIKIILTYSMD